QPHLPRRRPPPQRHACLAVTTDGTIVRTLKAGNAKIAFDGRVGGRNLAVGAHRLVLLARDAAGNTSKPVTPRLTVLATKRQRCTSQLINDPNEPTRPPPARNAQPSDGTATPLSVAARAPSVPTPTVSQNETSPRGCKESTGGDLSYLREGTCHQ